LLRSKWAAGKAVRAGLAVEGAYLNRYVTDEQRGRRPIFIATLWAGASWLFFRVARSTRMTRIWALRSRLEQQPTDPRQNTSYFGDRTLAFNRSRFALWLECFWAFNGCSWPDSVRVEPHPTRAWSNRSCVAQRLTAGSNLISGHRPRMVGAGDQQVTAFSTARQ
jgi:hypothetical protein